MLFGFLLSPVVEWDTRHGCKYVIIKRENVFKTQYTGTSAQVRALLDNKNFDAVKANTETKPVF